MSFAYFGPEEVMTDYAQRYNIAEGEIFVATPENLASRSEERITLVVPKEFEPSLEFTRAFEIIKFTNQKYYDKMREMML